MLSNGNIKDIVDESLKNGHIVTVRDIAYVVLCNTFDDKEVVYKCLFGNSDGCDSYNDTSAVSYLRQYIQFVLEQNGGSQKRKDISFEENKEYMLNLRRETEEAIKTKAIDKKDGLKILADISVKLNDKFNVNDSSQEQIIIVNQKYDDICPYCQHEVARRPISKNEAMSIYNLIEKE